jgi:hypothetical protein
MNKLLFSLYILSFITVPFLGHSQELVPVTLNTRVSNSQLIVEAQVTSKRSFWDDNHSNIYTASKVKIFKVFKGTVNTEFIEIITPGGTVGLQKEVVHPSLELNKDEVGIFMLHENLISTKKNPNIPLYKPYASVQGFVKYDLLKNKASSAFDQFNNIEQLLYSSITAITRESITEVSPFSVEQEVSPMPEATPTITSFTPTTVTAGTKTQVTITGTNFGATKGVVSFSDANNGGSSFYDVLATQIISWNNTQIVVEVPSRAGTGSIQVENTDPSSVTSATSLTVSYAQINAEFDPGSGTEAYQTQHQDDNSTGGYTWQMFTDFDSDAAAKASFIRAFTSWTSCAGTKINWTIGAVTTTDIAADDNINIIRFDNSAELPAGVLGRCTSRFSGCLDGSGGIDWFVKELDIVFDDATNWNYSTGSPGSTEYDFETVSVHELGHAHQLGHVNSPGAIMHYSVSNGSQNRTLSANDLAGGNDVMSRSTTTSVCAQNIMTAIAPCSIFWDGGAGTTAWTDASNWDTDVVPTSTDKVILDNTHVSGNYTVNLSASQTIKDLEIDLGANTVTLSGGNGLNVAGVVSPTSGTIISNGQLTLKATTSNDYGQIAVGSGTISGNVVNEWYFSGANGMRHIASPVTCNLSGLSDDFNTINFTSDATGSIWAWNASTSEWITPSGGSSSSFNQGISVFCGSSSGAAFSTLPLTIDALGPIVSGNQAQSLSFSSGSGPDFENGADGWNFVYNPYPSSIQWSLVTAGAYPAELASTYYYWDANSGLEGAYASYNPSTATSVNGATNFITKGRAFWVQASSAPSSALSFTDAMRTAEETPSMKTQSDGVSNQITLTANSNSFDDNAYYGEFLGATKKYDPAFDHLKMSGTSDASIYIENEARKLAYNTVSKYQYPLPFKVLAKNTGKIEIGVSLADDFFGDEPRFIQNLTTGKIHDLQDGDLEISTSANKEYAFLLLHVKTDAKDNITPFTYTRKGIIGVNLMQSEVYTKIEVLDISGRLVESANIQKNAQHVELQIKKSGTFIIRLSSPRGAQFIEKVVLIN